MQAVCFSCPDCNTKVGLLLATVIEGEVKFVAHCEDCQEQVTFRLDAILASIQGLFLVDPPKDNKVN